MLIDYVSELDVKFLFDEISTDDLYLIQGAEQPLTGGDKEEEVVIVDVGANIGLFALEALKKSHKITESAYYTRSNRHRKRLKR